MLAASEIGARNRADSEAAETVLAFDMGGTTAKGSFLAGGRVEVKPGLEVAREVGAEAFVHGATGKGNDQCRFQLAAEALEPDVKMISFSEAPIRLAICSRAVCTDSSAFQPNAWLRIAALPKSFWKKGSMASSTRGSTGVVAW